MRTRGSLGSVAVTLCAALLAAALAPQSPAAQPTSREAPAVPIEVPRWEPRDFVFTHPAAIDNPFRVPLSADLTGPGGIKMTVPGFYDGEGTWKLRVSPTVEGEWSLRTRSTTPELDGRQASFTCVANPSPHNHGSLRVDPENRRQFIFEDGARFFPSGYECDWLWALDVNDPQLPTVNRFLDKLVDHGFNFIILNAYAHDTSWRKGRTADDDFGPPPLYAWEGTNDAPDHSRFNLAYWQHYDRVMNAMHRRGIGVHLFFKVYNKAVKWPEKRSEDEDQYFRMIIARYGAYPNVHWDFAKESQYEKDKPYLVERLRFIRATDAYKRLLTVHDDRAEYDRGTYDALVDYRSDQQHKDWRQSIIDHHRQREWPVVNTEYGYEHGPGGMRDKTYNQVQSPEEVCRRAWLVYIAGGFGAYYYTNTAWDVLRVDETPPGYAYLKHLRTFFEGTGYWRMRPLEDVTTQGHCLGEPGKEYIVFLDKAAAFDLKLDGLAQPLKAQWFHPFTGQRHDAGELGNGTSKLTPPAEWGEGPVALRVGTAP